MPVFNNMLAGASGGAGAGYEIERSLRFNSGDSAYLNRTPSAAGNRESWTWSGWVKQSSLATSRQCLFGAYGANSDTDFLDIGFDGNSIYATVNSVASQGTAKFRDPSAWFHYFVRYDGSNLKWFINGVETHTWARTGNLAVNGAFAHQIGRSPGGGGRYFDGYLADVHFIDGQALAPTDFGETDNNGVWQPKKFEGTYGTLVNQSQTWTSNVTNQNSSYPATNAFNGVISNASWRNNGSPSILTFATPINIVGKTVEVMGAGLNNDNHMLVNGISITGWNGSINDLVFNDITSQLGGATTLTSIELRVSGEAFQALRIGGELYVDSGVTVPDNSFHLDFSDNSSNAALGNDAAGNNNWTVNNLTAGFGNGRYVSDVTGTPYSSAYPNISAFDGSLSTYSQSVNGGNITFTPSTPISVSSTLKVVAYTTGSTATFTVNGNNYRSLFTTTGTQTVTIPETSITTIVWGRTSDGSSSVQIQAIEVDGSYLIDYAASGNANIDSLVDTPTNGTQVDSGVGGEVVGNYATLNPLTLPGGGTLSNGNLKFSSGGDWDPTSATIGVSSGKWYWEYMFEGTNMESGITAHPNTENWTGNYQGSVGIGNYAEKYVNGTTTNPSGWSTIATGSIVGNELDLDNGTFRHYVNGVVAPSYATQSLDTSLTWFPSGSVYGSSHLTYNFGSRAFAYTAPSGYKALCTANLPDPTIEDGSTAFDAVLYTGDGNSTQTITGLKFAPDLTWQKIRNLAGDHGLTDSVRGVSAGYLKSHSTNLETGSSTNGVSAFTPDGFTAAGSFNTNNNNWVTWAWDAGSSTVSNTYGTITSQVRANPSAGFSIVSYTGTGANATVGHGLNAAPKMIITKNRSANASWAVYHSELGNTSLLQLEKTDAVVTSATAWNSTNPTSSVFSVGNYPDTNNSSETFIGYCFAPVESYSAIGSYVGNGSADGPFVYTGFKPAWILIKESSASGNNWNIWDTERDSFNALDNQLKASSSGAEATNTFADYLSNGFKIRGTAGGLNGNNATHIYIAFASNPFKTARAR